MVMSLVELLGSWRSQLKSGFPAVFESLSSDLLQLSKRKQEKVLEPGFESVLSAAGIVCGCGAG